VTAFLSLPHCGKITETACEWGTALHWQVAAVIKALFALSLISNIMMKENCLVVCGASMQHVLHEPIRIHAGQHAIKFQQLTTQSN
jgi:hypothetical protein